MRKILVLFLRFVFLTIFVFLCFAGIDYYRMTKGKLPIFQITTYNTKTKEQAFHGAFYTAKRTVRANPDELLEESSDIEFLLFTFPVDLKIEKSKKSNDFKVLVMAKDSCGTSTLVYADLKTKIYTYCLEDIQVENSDGKESLTSILSKDTSIVEQIKGKLAYMGLLSDGKTQQFDSREGEEVDVRIYQCDNLYVNDVYIGPKDMTLQSDFCTFKDDDFLFLYELSDESPEILDPIKNDKGEVVPEVFLEDEAYRYEFELPKSQYIFIKTPANRGREERKYSLRDILDRKVLTIEQLENKGLTFNKIDKAKEAEEKRKKEEEEKQKQIEEEQKKNNPQS